MEFGQVGQRTVRYRERLKPQKLCKISMSTDCFCQKQNPIIKALIIQGKGVDPRAQNIDQVLYWEKVHYLLQHHHLENDVENLRFGKYSEGFRLRDFIQVLRLVVARQPNPHLPQTTESVSWLLLSSQWVS